MINWLRVPHWDSYLWYICDSICSISQILYFIFSTWLPMYYSSDLYSSIVSLDSVFSSRRSPRFPKSRSYSLCFSSRVHQLGPTLCHWNCWRKHDLICGITRVRCHLSIYWVLCWCTHRRACDVLRPASPGCWFSWWIYASQVFSILWY